MELSARNQLKGTVKKIALGEVMAEVVMDVGGQEVVAAIDQALAETSRLAERQLGVQDELKNGGDQAGRLRAEQGAIEEGVQRLLDHMRQAAGKNAMVSPEIGNALGGAQRQMQLTREAISNASAQDSGYTELADRATRAAGTRTVDRRASRGSGSGTGSA